MRAQAAPSPRAAQIARNHTNQGTGPTRPPRPTRSRSPPLARVVTGDYEQQRRGRAEYSPKRPHDPRHAEPRRSALAARPPTQGRAAARRRQRYPSLPDKARDGAPSAHSSLTSRLTQHDARQGPADRRNAPLSGQPSLA